MIRSLADQRDRSLIANALDDTLIVEAAAGTGKQPSSCGELFASSRADELRSRRLLPSPLPRRPLASSNSGCAKRSKRREEPLVPALGSGVGWIMPFGNSKRHKSARSTDSAPISSVSAPSRRRSIRSSPC